MVRLLIYSKDNRLKVKRALTDFGSPFPAIPSLVPKARKPCYLSQTAGLHRFLILCIKIITPQPLRGSGISGAKIRRKTEICRENRRKIEINRENLAAFVSNHIYNVRCFTQPFRTFAYEKTRSMIPRDFRTEVWLVEGTPIPKQSRNIPETIPKDR